MRNIKLPIYILYIYMYVCKQFNPVYAISLEEVNTYSLVLPVSLAGYITFKKDVLYLQ